MSGTTRNKTIGARVSQAEYDAFLALATSKGFEKHSEFLRLILSKLLPNDIQPGEQAGKERRHSSMFMSWSEREAKAIKERALREGTNAQGWVRRVVIAALTKKPQPTKTEEQALRESNRELLALGRNINQIAHKLNVSIREVDLVHAEMLEQLAAEIREHRRIVTSVLNANWDRLGEASDKESEE